jgi:hypothetical protein
LFVSYFERTSVGNNECSAGASVTKTAALLGVSKATILRL